MAGLKAESLVLSIWMLNVYGQHHGHRWAVGTQSHRDYNHQLPIMVQGSSLNAQEGDREKLRTHWKRTNQMIEPRVIMETGTGTHYDCPLKLPITAPKSLYCPFHTLVFHIFGSSHIHKLIKITNIMYVSPTYKGKKCLANVKYETATHFLLVFI